MTLTFKVKLLNLTKFYYNFVIMNCLQTLTKQHLGQDLLEPQTEIDLYLYVTLTIKVKLLNLSKIA